MPNPKECFHAAQIRPALCWCDRNYAAKWKNLEEFVQGREIQSLIGGRDETMWILSPNLHWDSGLILEESTNWRKSLEGFGGKDQSFTPGSLDQKFKQWIPRGITAMCTVIVNGICMSFQEIKQKPLIDNQDHFRYL